MELLILEAEEGVLAFNQLTVPSLATNSKSTFPRAIIGRGGRTRTGDLHVPNVAPYQLGHTPYTSHSTHWKGA